MSQPSDQPQPHYVIGHCQHCDGHIEFDANQLAEENTVAPCPHCGQETKLSVPVETLPAERRKGFFGGLPSPPEIPPPSKPNVPWNHQPATPKQVAYLTYMGVTNAAHLTKKQASDLIDANSFSDGATSIAAFERIQARQTQWHEERLKLYPDLYAFELQEFLGEDLPASLHGYVRKRIVGASETLTKAKIRRVIETLTGENSCWWHQSNHPELFFERLRQMYPGCCDGHPTPALNIAESSPHVEQVFNHSDPTQRQIMLLRFWNRMDLANRSRGEIVNWLENFYAQDSRRKSAWELYKLQNKDDGTQHDPSWVKIGEGENCLRDLIAWRKKAGFILLGVAVLIVAVVIVIVHLSGN
jgi:hypothetical protein